MFDTVILVIQLTQDINNGYSIVYYKLRLLYIIPMFYIYYLNCIHSVVSHVMKPIVIYWKPYLKKYLSQVIFWIELC
jgi:hypothetical protein